VLLLLVRVFGKNNRRHIGLLLTGAVVAVLAGGGAFAAVTPDTPFSTGLYWAVVTAATVGYGDVSPKNPAGRVVAVLVMLTAIPLLAAVFALVTGAAAVAGLRRILEMEHPFPAGSYRLVLGSHPAVPGVLDDLAEADEDVVLVADVDQAKMPKHVHVVRGDPTRADVLHAAKPEGAQQALITGGSDSDVLVTAVLLRKRAPDLPLTALVGSPSVREALRELGVHQVISTDALLAHTLAKSLETPHAGELIGHLVDSDEHDLVEVEADGQAQGRPLSAIRNEREGLVLALVHDGQLTLGIGADPVIAPGDRLLVAEKSTGARRAD
jgi:voltage-gated potassium channel